MIAYRFRAARMWIIIPSYTVFGLSLFATALTSALITRGIVRSPTYIVERPMQARWPAWGEETKGTFYAQQDYEGWQVTYYRGAPRELTPPAEEWR